MSDGRTADKDALSEAAAAIQRRIDLIRRAVPDIVPGDYQTAFADGMTSALSEIWAVQRRPIPPGSTDAYQRGQHDLAAKVEALHHPDITGEFCDHCWTGPDSHGNGPSPWWPCATIQLLADALPQDADSEPASVPLAAEDDSGAAMDVPDAAGLSEAQGGAEAFEVRYCPSCGEHYNAFAESHVGHETRNAGAGL